VYPRCAYFGAHKCGRCQWQHIDYKAQLLLKQDVLADQLARIGGFEDADVRATIPSAAQWGYNYHMTMLPTADGGFGFPGADEGAVIAADECHIMHPDLFDLYVRIDLETGGLTRL
jgi:23S rRNA (uracil1939-C5)-methyltransferase